MAAAIMSVNAVAIDALLPALAAVGDALQAGQGNRRQWLITVYLLGFGLLQIVYGTLSDHFGRKPLLMIGLALYAAFAGLCTLSGSFELTVLMRLLQGCGGAASVLAISIIRDRYEGAQMARVMSLAFMLFLGVPIFAPSLGQLILLLASWQWVLGAITLFGLLLLPWVALRLPETLPAQRRMPLSFASVAQAIGAVLTQRASLGYTLATTVLFGALFGIVNSGQQLFAGVFHAAAMFPVVFGVVAACVAAAAVLNGRLVSAHGIRRTSHAALLGYLGVAVVHALVAWTGQEGPWLFTLLQSGMMFCFGLIIANFGALAMSQLGHIAGTASAVQSLVANVGGALIGMLIGQRFDGSAMPMTLGAAGCAAVALALVLWAERGVLFQPAPQVLPARAMDPAT